MVKLNAKLEELEYSREVFERIRTLLLDAVMWGDTLRPDDDYAIAPNYDIGEDGIYLRLGEQDHDSLRWTPECDRDGGRPLGNKGLALPFPFGARHLAAFVLGGWGWHLGSGLGLVCAPYDPDEQDRQHEWALNRLGGVADRECRDAIAGARKCLEQACSKVGGAYPLLRESERALRLALERAGDDRLPATRISKFQREHETASREVDAAEPGWRKAMVNVLLAPGVVDATGSRPNANDSAEQRQHQRGASDAHQKGMPWTQAMLDELKRVRADVGTTAAAAQFGITPSRLRALLPGPKGKAPAHDPFGRVRKR